jgi:hypothetical protein
LLTHRTRSINFDTYIYASTFKVAYFGKAGDALDYLEGLGFPCAIHFNPADFLRKYMFCYIALKWITKNNKWQSWSWLYFLVVGFITTYAISVYHLQCCEFEPRSGEVNSIQHYVIKFVSDLWQVGGFLWFPPLQKWPLRNNWNIVESGFKHNNPNPNSI